MSETLQTVEPDGGSTEALARILRDLDALEFLSKIVGSGEDDDSLGALGAYKPAKLASKFGFSSDLAAAFAQKCRDAISDPLPEPVQDYTHERTLWLKACLILEACTKGARPFVGAVMERLHRKVAELVKLDITREIGVCETEDWDCSHCSDAADVNFTENAPVFLKITAFDTTGVADCGFPHYLKPRVLKPCHMTQQGFRCLFPDAVLKSPIIPLSICSNPADIENPKTSTFVLLHNIILDTSMQHLAPFPVTLCGPSESAFEFHAVLCCSRPSYTMQLVGSFLKQAPLRLTDELPLLFGFWSLAKDGNEFSELKHGLKQGQTVQFGGDNLPRGLVQGCQYMVSEPISKFSFSVCGPILCPAVPLAVDASADDSSPLGVFRKSPIGR